MIMRKSKKFFLEIPSRKKAIETAIKQLKANEVLLSTRLSKRLNLNPGEVVTFIGSTMHGAFTTFNFTVVGIFSLNMGPVDKEMMLLDISGARLALDMENVLIDSIICNWDNGVDERQYNTWGYTQTTKSMEKTIRVNKLHLLPGMLKHHIMKMNETLETYVVDERSSIITKLLDQWTHPSWKQTHEYFENKIQQLKDEKHVLQERSRRNQANKGLASEIKVMKAEIVKFEKIAKEIDSDINDFSDGELVKLIKGCK